MNTTAKALTRHVPQIGETLFVTITDRNNDAALGTSREGFEVVLPLSEDLLHAPVQIGTKLFVLVTSTDSMLLVSRTHQDLPRRILEGFVPELTSADVVVVASARDPGHRTKIVVAAVTPDVDPVAACVGRGGKRVAQTVALLGGERVELITWSPVPETYLANALAPARVNHVKIRNGHATVWAEPHLMAATVGENGQNSLLAGMLLGVKIHVESGTPPANPSTPEAPDATSDLSECPVEDLVVTTENTDTALTPDTPPATAPLTLEDSDDLPPLPPPGSTTAATSPQTDFPVGDDAEFPPIPPPLSVDQPAGGTTKGVQA